METLARKILEFRAKKDITQPQLADLCGLSVPTIVNAENGRKIKQISEMKILVTIERESKNESEQQ